MKINFRVDSLDSHAHLTLFVNGAHSGNICLREGELQEFVERLGPERIEQRGTVKIRQEDGSYILRDL